MYIKNIKIHVYKNMPNESVSILAAVYLSRLRGMYGIIKERNLF